MVPRHECRNLLSFLYISPWNIRLTGVHAIFFMAFVLCVRRIHFYRQYCETYTLKLSQLYSKCTIARKKMFQYGSSVEQRQDCRKRFHFLTILGSRADAMYGLFIS
jgi:hypothetical protein